MAKEKIIKKEEKKEIKEASEEEKIKPATEANEEVSKEKEIKEASEEEKNEADEEFKEEKAAEKKKLGRIGIANIYTSFNNTIINITDLSGKTIARVSGGMTTKHDRLKANPTVAMFSAKRAAEQAKDAGITSLYVRIKAKTASPAPGPGAHSAVRSLLREGLKIINIVDVTSIPRGGPKQPGGKRGRRV